MKKLLLIRFGEIHLKGLNRPFFIKKLVNRIKAITKLYGVFVWFEDSRVYVSNINESNIDVIIKRVQKVFGVHSLSIAYELSDKSIENISSVAIELMKNKAGTFKIQARRSDKSYPLDSPEINSLVGGKVLESNSNLKVDVKKPGTVLSIEVRKFAYLYTDIILANGGMPVGTNGKATVLLSGGIDSPVAAWMIAKRGVEINAVHFYSPPYTSDKALQKVIDLAERLSESLCGIRLHVINFTNIQLEIHEKCLDDLTTIIMRRMMMRISDRIAHGEGSLGIITGESIGQVASQTMPAMLCVNNATDLPIYRPLVGLDKQEIIDIANKIDTMEISSQPFEDCCTVFTPKHPKTQPKLKLVEEQEGLLDIEELITSALKNYQIYEFDIYGECSIHNIAN